MCVHVHMGVCVHVSPSWGRVSRWVGTDSSTTQKLVSHQAYPAGGSEVRMGCERQARERGLSPEGHEEPWKALS